MIKLDQVDTTFEREPLLKPLGFKGGYLSELWQAVTLMRSDGQEAVGLGTQSVLWSDSSVFAAHSEAGGNVLMFAATEYAAQLAKTISFQDPLDLLDRLLPPVYEYARSITGNPNLRKTFALNALVAVDNAAWMLHARRSGDSSFEALIPEPYRPALSHRHDGVAAIPTVSYGTTTEQMTELGRRGYFFIKVKLGHPGDRSEMLRDDVRRLEEVHGAFSPLETDRTSDGRVAYYLDINGRYDKQALLQLLEHAERIGAIDRIALLEEPFPEDYEADVSDVNVRLAADESAHTDEDARRRIEMGYGAIALKPIAKTLSMTLKIARVARQHDVPCFCADLTVNPILVDWNKTVAARLPPLPGVEVGLLETNGAQNYRDWDKMETYHPSAGASWTRVEDGMFALDRDFYSRDAAIFELPDHYRRLFSP